MAKITHVSLQPHRIFSFGRILNMLKKRIVVTAITLCLSIPGLSQATPLSRMPGTDVLAKLTRLLDRLPGAHHARPARSLAKQGCGMDPNGVPLPCGG
jgi:hypothetical protein